MRVVFDTVVFVRALINRKGPVGEILFVHANRYELLVSPDILKEVMQVLHRPLLRARFPSLEGIRFAQIAQLLDEAKLVEPHEHLTVCRDPDDNKFLECAVAGKAEYIVTEDKDLQVIGEYRGVKIIDTFRFLRLLKEG